MVGFLVLFMVTVYAFAVFLIGDDLRSGIGPAAIALVVGGLVALLSYYKGGNLVLAMSGAKEIKKEDDPQLWNVVEELSIAGGLPMPRIYVIDDTALNAFATGRDPQHASVAITKGLRSRLERAELQGVLAHELSHVRNYDIRYSMLLAVMVGLLVLLADVFRRWLWWGGGRRRSRRVGRGRRRRHGHHRGGGHRALHHRPAPGQAHPARGLARAGVPGRRLGGRAHPVSRGAGFGPGEAGRGQGGPGGGQPGHRSTSTS